MVPGIAGLLLALRGTCGTRARALGFLHGMILFGVGLSWLYQVFGLVTVVLWMVLAAFTALFAEFQTRAAIRGWSGWGFAAFTAVNWCGWEFIRGELFPLKFPWMTAGLAMGPNALLPWVGVYGVSLLVVLAAAFLATRQLKPMLLLLVILIAAIRMPAKYPLPAADDPRSVRVAGLQFENRSMGDFLSKTREMPNDIQHVIWPEYAVPFDVRANKRDWESLNDLCRDRGITLTLGTQVGPGGDKWRNIALTLDPTGVLGEHTKVHPVHFFDDGTPGTTALPVKTRYGNVGTPICFDCDYEGVVRKMTEAGAEYFMVPVMDAEPWTARQHEQHAELFRIRACENQRWMFVCATSGISQWIDPNGFVHGRLSAAEQGPLFGRISREIRLSIYTRFGWLTPWCVLAVSTLCWSALILPARWIGGSGPEVQSQPIRTTATPEK